MLYLSLILLTILNWFLYKRYFPVAGVQNIECFQLEIEQVTIIDLRDYNLSIHSPILGAINIPVAYLNRNFTDIPKDDKIHVIASGRLEKNVGIRFLRYKGYEVVGYTIVNN